MFYCKLFNKNHVQISNGIGFTKEEAIDDADEHLYNSDSKEKAYYYEVVEI